MRGSHAGFLLAALLTCGAGQAADWSPPRILSHSPWPARLQYNFGWAIDVDAAGMVHAAWLEVASEDPPGHGTGRVMYTRSGGDGRSWSPPRSLTGAPLPATGHPRVAASGRHVFVAWHGLHDGSGVMKIYLMVSADHGATWYGPKPVSDHTHATGGGAWPSVNACGDAVHVVWGDSRSGAAEIYLRSSPDGGAHWTPVRQVSSPDGRSSWVPTVACRGTEVHVAWADERHNVDEAGVPYDCGIANEARCREEEYYRRSLDFGASWEPEVRLTHDAARMPRPSWAPSIAVVDDTVHVVFFDARTDRFQIYYLRGTSEEGMAPQWEPERMISHDDGATIHARPVIAARGEELHVVWYAITPSVGAHVLYAASSDGGDSFGAPEILTTRPAMAEPHASVAASPRGSAHVIWQQADGRGVDQVVHRRRRDIER